MAAVTPARVTRESVGSLTLHIATFASIDSSTWKSGLPNAVAWWASAQSSGTGAISVTASSSGSTGTTFTMTTRLAAGKVDLFVLSNS